MTALPRTLADPATMLRRNLRHMLRYPSLTVLLVAMPVVFLLLFVYVFGGALGAGLGGAAAGRAEYTAYVTPGILLMTLAGTAQGTAVSVAMDMTEGIVARFRTMAISRAAVLTGHVAGSMVQAALSVALVLGVAVLIGFRPDAGAVEWTAAAGMLALVALALTWLAVALGLAADSVETASNTPMPLMLLPFLGSGFVPTASMPAGLRWIAEWNPLSATVAATRDLFGNPEVAHSGGWASEHALGLAVAWPIVLLCVFVLPAVRRARTLGR